MRRVTVVLSVVGVLVAAGGLGWLLAFSPVLGVRTVTVRGTRVVTAAQVRSAARIARGTPLVRLDTAAVRRRVQALAPVASVTVRRSLPSTVTVTVVERQPVGYLAEHGRYLLVDRTGRSFRTVTRTPADVPHLEVAGSGAAARVAAAVAAALPARLRSLAVSLQAVDGRSVTVVFPGGRLVQWGTATRNTDKARIVGALLTRLDPLIDVSDPDQPFTR